MMRIVAAVVSLVFAAGVALAAGGGEIDEPTPKPGQTPSLSGEHWYNEGQTLTDEHQWRPAERAFREAIRMKPDLPEAWNGLGHALKHQGRFDESINAYEEALRLRPNYAQALEYLGEAYVILGKLDKARALHEHLKTLNPALADQLASAIQGTTSAW